MQANLYPHKMEVVGTPSLVVFTVLQCFISKFVHSQFLILWKFMYSV